MPRRKRTGNRTFPKRATLWVPFDVTASLVTAGTKVVSNDILGNYFGQTGEEVPVGTALGPVRGIWSLAPTVATTTEQNYRVEAVLQLVMEGGRAVEVTPGVDISYSPWYGQFTYTGQLIEDASGTFAAPAVEKELVTKAMRKITGNGQEYQFTAVGSGNTDFTVRWIGVVMLKLP